jgi:pimeloyl-ACP methyl ester carboxylesterase
VGHRRQWRWRGWQVHYTYTRSPVIAEPAANQSPVLFLHGFGASIGHWRQNIPALASHHPVYALDLLGFGASEKAATGYELGLWVDQVYDFWRTFINRPVVLVGHSLGSSVGLALAAAHPEMVQGLAMFTLPDSSVLEIPSWLRSSPLSAVFNVAVAGVKRAITFPPLFSPLFRLVRRPGTIQGWAKGAYGQTDVVDAELVGVFSQPAYDRGARRALAAMVNGRTNPARQYLAREILPQIQVPMLLIWGSADRAVPPNLARKFLRYSDRIELVELEKVGHCAHDECADAMNQRLLAWIAGLPQLNLG